MPVPDFSQGIQISFLDSATRARMKGHSAAAPAPSGAASTASAATSPTPGGTTQTASDATPPLSFDDIVDIVNPLQHLPIVSTLYRHYANDPINTFPKIAGDTLYGGPLGLLSSVADTAFEKITGKSFGDTVLAWVTGDDAPAAGTAVASAAKSGSSAAAPAATPAGPAAAVTHARPASLPATSPTKLAASAPKAPLRPASSQMPNLDPASFNALSAFLRDKGIEGDTSQRTLDAYRRTMQLGTELPPSPQMLH